MRWSMTYRPLSRSTGFSRRRLFRLAAISTGPAQASPLVSYQPRSATVVSPPLALAWAGFATLRHPPALPHGLLSATPPPASWSGSVHCSLQGTGLRRSCPGPLGAAGETSLRSNASRIDSLPGSPSALCRQSDSRPASIDSMLTELIGGCQAAESCGTTTAGAVRGASG